MFWLAEDDCGAAQSAASRSLQSGLDLYLRRSAVSKCCKVDVSLVVLTHLSVHEGELSIWSPHSSITGTFGRICLRLCATSKSACCLTRLSSTTAATECMRYSSATPCVGLFVLTTSQPFSLT